MAEGVGVLFGVLVVGGLSGFTFGVFFGFGAGAAGLACVVDEVADSDGVVAGSVVVGLESVEEVVASEVVAVDLFGPGEDASFVGFGGVVVEVSGEFEYFGDVGEVVFGGVDVHSVVTSWRSSARAAS